MPNSNQINPFNYNIDNFDSGFLGPISDTNFRTYLFTHNLGQPNSVISGVISNPWADRGTEYDVSQSSFNVADVPNLQTVANTPSVFNNLTNPRQVNIGSNLPNINPQVQATIGQNNLTQAGQGIDSATQINQNPSNVDVPGLQTVANTPSVYNNLTNPRQVNLAGNLTTIDPAIQSNIGQTTPVQAGQGIDATTLFNTNVANIDVPSPTIVAVTPSVYNNQTNPRQVNLAGNLSQINPAIQANIGLTTPAQAGQGVDATTLFNTNTSNLDLPSAEDAAQISSNINNFTTPRQDNLDMNPTLTELENWYPIQYDVILAANSNDYNTSYGVPQTLKIGFVGNIDAWVEPSGVVTPSLLYSLQNIINVSNNKWGPSSLNVQTWVGNGIEQSTLVSDTGLVEYKTESNGLLAELFETANDFQSQITGISLANPIQLGVGIIPFSDIGSGIDFKPGGQKTQLEKIAGKRRLTELANRVISNAIDDTIGRFSFLERPFATLAGGNAFEKNYIITSRKGATGSILQTASSLVGLNAIGTNFITGPDIPDDAFKGTNDIGPSFGINLADKNSWDISEAILDRTGNATRSLIFEALSRNKYKPRTQRQQGFLGTNIGSPYEKKENQRNYLTYDRDVNLSEEVGDAIDDLAQGDDLTRRARRKLRKAKKAIEKLNAKEAKEEFPTEFNNPTANKTPSYGGFFGNNQAGVIDDFTYSDDAGFRPDISAEEVLQKPSTTWQGDNPYQLYPNGQTTHEGFDWRYRDPSGFKKGLLQYTQWIVNQAASNSDDYVPSSKSKVSAQAMIQNPAGLVGYFDSDISFKRKSKTVTTTKTKVITPERIVTVAPTSFASEIEGVGIATTTIPAVTETITETKVVEENADPESSAHLTGVETLDSWPTLPSKGNQVRNATIKTTKDSLGNKKFSGVEGGDVYCRSWTSRRKYHKRSNLIRSEGNWWKIPKGNESIMTMNYPSQQNGSPKIAWDSYDSEQYRNLNPGQDFNKLQGVVIPYMFSIENLAWKDAPQKRNLPGCEVGPNGGRIMWFPPYDINFSDNTSVNWDKTDFIGRGEAIYTYNNTERSGNLSWTIVVDHPEVLNNMRNTFKGSISKIAADGTINSFFAGCTSLKELFEPYIKPTFVPPPEEVCKDCNRTVIKPKDPPFKTFQVYFDNAVNCESPWQAPDPKTSQCGTAGQCAGRVVDWNYENTVINIASYFNGLKFSDCPAYLNSGLGAGSTYYRTAGLNSSTGVQYASLDPTEDEMVAALNQKELEDRASKQIATGYESLKELAKFLVTADGKNYRIKATGYTSASQPNKKNSGKTTLSKCLNDLNEEGGVTFNKILAYHRARSLMRILYDEMVKAEEEQGGPPFFDNDPKTGKKYPAEKGMWNPCNTKIGGGDTASKTEYGCNEDSDSCQRWRRFNDAQTSQSFKTCTPYCKSKSIIGRASYKQMVSKEGSYKDFFPEEFNQLPYCQDMPYNGCNNGKCYDSPGYDVSIESTKGKGNGNTKQILGPSWCYSNVDSSEPPGPADTNEVFLEDTQLWTDFTETNLSPFGKCNAPRGFGCFEGNPCLVRGLEESQANSYTAKLARKAEIELEVNYYWQQKIIDEINKENNAKFKEEEAKRIEQAKLEFDSLVNNISTNYINECDYFLEMKKDAPFVYNNLMDKIENFHPAFHAITPEGFNSRLTFLQQCTRQGPQIMNEDLPNNMVFGRPPVCVLRIGDFYHTKIIIESVNFNFEPLQWDLNPEGIGVQPMLVKVDMSFKFIGGSSLGGPIQQLQNAVTYNFFANTGVYRPKEEVKGPIESKQKIMYGAFITPQEERDFYGIGSEAVVEDDYVPDPNDGFLLDEVNITAAEGDQLEPDAIPEVKPNNNATNTGQAANNKPATTNPNEKVIPIDFESTNLDAAHDFNAGMQIEDKVVKAMEELYNSGVNPIVKSVKVTITDRQNGPFTNRYKTTGEVIVGDNGKGNEAFTGFSTRGSIGSDNGQRAYEQRWLPKPGEGTTLEQRLATCCKAVKFQDVNCGGKETPPTGQPSKGVNPLVITVVNAPGVQLTQYFIMFSKFDKPKK